MRENTYLLSTAYFPPVHYLSVFKKADKVLIEKQDNYIKQTYRNRCTIYSANGPMMLTVPVLQGSFHKIPVKDIKIDYSKRWQKVHLRALVSAYRSAPFFEFFFSCFEEVIIRKHIFLLDLNLHSLEVVLKASEIETPYYFTSAFQPVTGSDLDYRNRIAPKKNADDSYPELRKYNQVFEDRYGFIPGLSMIDLIFNAGPDAPAYL